MLIAILDNESLICVFRFLDEEESTHMRELNNDTSPSWRMLRSLMHTKSAFNSYARQLAVDIRRAEESATFWRSLSPNSTSGLMGLANEWGLIPPIQRGNTLALIIWIITNRNWMLSLDEVISSVDILGGAIVMLILAFIYLSGQAIIHFHSCWNGEISRQQCTRNIIDSVNIFAVGCLGGMMGNAAGSAFGPPGRFLFGVLGGIICSNITSFQINRRVQPLVNNEQNQ